MVSRVACPRSAWITCTGILLFKGSKKIKVSKRVWYTPNTTGLEEKDGTDGGVEGSVDQDSQTTQRKCTSSVSGTHGQGIGPRWGKPRRTEVGLESQNDPQRDA